ncbi:MAG TPA: carboxypeptidase regulatory-like domain-containing protein, partial [Vicinamibacterales bacterium]
MRVFGIVGIAVSVVVSLAGSAEAQAVGQILGVVTDPTGAVLPKVAVTVSGTGLQQPVVRTTTTDGAYTVPDVPIGTYVVAFELNAFKKAVRPNVVITTGFSATVSMKLELGPVGEEVEVTGAPPLVDTKRTTTGATITLDVMTDVPTARDPFQAINLAPSVVLNGTAANNILNVGGSAAGTPLSPTAFSLVNGSPMWSLEGGSITDMTTLGPPTFFNFDSFQEIQVITGGADVTVQASGVYINLVTKSGSNVVKGTGDVTFENSSLQAQNVTEAMFRGNTSGTAIGLSGNPIHRIDTFDGDIGGPIIRNRLWYWGAASNQDVNLSIGSFFNTALS